MKARAPNVMHQKPSVLQPVDLGSAALGQTEQVFDCGFVSLLWLHRIIEARLCLQCEHTFSNQCLCPHVCVCWSFCSDQKCDLSLPFSERNGLLWSRIPLLSWLLACTHFLSSPSVEPALCMDCACFLFNNIWPGQELRSFTAAYLQCVCVGGSFYLMWAAPQNRGRELI